MNILNMQGLSTEQVITPLGGLGVVAQHEKLLQDIETLLLTRRGSVIGNPLYGSNLHEYLFDLSSDTTISLIEKEIEAILLENYNFITAVTTQADINGTTLHIVINYSTNNSSLSTKLEFTIPISEEGGINYE